MINNKPSFLDLFAGCGGLSLGLIQAGWHGVFAIEQNANAFQTLRHNLIDGLSYGGFDWPHWLPKRETTIEELLDRFKVELSSYKGEVDLIAGGPPCQGFSLAGRRNEKDPRNTLYKEYVEMVKIIEPKYLLLENVKGIATAFKKNEESLSSDPCNNSSYAERITLALESIGYNTRWKLLKASDYDVPQYRPRYFMIAVRKELFPDSRDVNFLIDAFKKLSINRHLFLIKKGLAYTDPITVKDAISDLETFGKERRQCLDSPRFEQIAYLGPKTTYQEIMHGAMNGKVPNSMRLVKHREKTIDTFRRIMDTCQPGVSLNDSHRRRLGIKKHCIVWMDANKPAHTLTTLPDDLLHYSEPRILTVREYARLQTFPDWFEFKGNYTTGGKRRKNDCPRYTQIGNAVPPLLAEAIGNTLIRMEKYMD